MSKAFVIVAVVVILVIAAFFFFPGDKIPFSGKKQAVHEFNITIFHTHYEPNSISVEQGSLVKLSLLAAPGTASYMHGLAVDGYSINALVTSETFPLEVSFVADRKGSFSGYCGSCLNGPFGRDAPDKRFIIVVR